MAPGDLSRRTSSCDYSFEPHPDSTVPNRDEKLRQDAATIYDAAVAGVEPGRALLRALESASSPERVSLVAVGKASVAMMSAAVEHLRAHGRVPRTGLMVTPEPGPAPHPSVTRVVGDHPLPGNASGQAAERVEVWCDGIEPGETVWAFISGGASSLIGAPVDPITTADYRVLQRALFGAGLPIDRLNRIRKRVGRWGAGRLATRLAAAAAIQVYLLSDVPSNEPADIGSGPFEPDDSTAASVRALLVEAIGADRIPDSVRRYLEQVDRGEHPETPTRGAPVFSRRANHLVASNQLALDHAARRARELGYTVTVADSRLEGDAAAAGRALVERIVAEPNDRPRAWLAGGETTVALAGLAGRGGRCQELCLAAAELVAGTDIVLLAAGTDGRDGPTDAAGGLVDGDTWTRLRAAGIDPAAALRRHDAYPALDRVAGLVRTGPTGTNVMDVVVALRTPARR
jgi:glycerate-2-kinase